MSKTVNIQFDEETEEYVADFYNDDAIFEHKTLTQVEVDGLLEVINFNRLPSTYKLEQIIEEVETAYFDNQGQVTNFELILQELNNQ